MTTVRDRLQSAGRELQARGIASARLDAEILLAHAIGVDRGRLLLDHDRALSAEIESRFATLLKRRQAREPVSHLLREREFWSLPFEVGPDVLDPRPDSETLIEAAAAHICKMPGRGILDLGTGSGCLLVSLLHECPEARGTGVDISADAVRRARRNAERNGVAGRAEFVEGGWDVALGRRFDIVVANPPYIPTADIEGLAPEVRDFEPHLALDGGTDGLDAYRVILPLLPSYLETGGMAFLEIGQGQAADIGGLAERSGLRVAEIRCDLGGIERCILLRLR